MNFLKSHFLAELGRAFFRGSIVAIALLLVLSTIAWFIPRNIIDLQMTTDKTVYEVGETINITNVFTLHQTGEASYERRIVCRNGVERRKLIDVISVTSVPTSGESKSQIIIPEMIPEHTCVVAVRASHKIEIAPFVTKTIVEVNESNEFSIK